MSSKAIRRAAFGILAVSFAGFLFGGALPLTLTGKFFIGAFGFGSGFVLLIVANILKIKEYESRQEEMVLPGEDDPSDDNEEAGT